MESKIIKTLTMAGVAAFKCGAARAAAAEVLNQEESIRPRHAIDEYFEKGADAGMAMSYHYDSQTRTRTLALVCGESDETVATIVSDAAASALAVYGDDTSMKPAAFYRRNRKSPKADDAEEQRAARLFAMLDEIEGRIPRNEHSQPIVMYSRPAGGRTLMSVGRSRQS
ncbi:hypothetical protein FACS1894186_5320 [Alphaproteobacteria bacterium]|nr:hypothetical protein FACS1894186_5320 [Alphaproteobacteria bacterium]